MRRHFSTVYGFFRSKVEHLGQDLAQSTFLKCVQGRDRFREESSFRVYILAIARNVLLRHFRDNARHGRNIDFAEVSLCDFQPSPSVVVGAREEQRVLLQAMQRIPLELQIAIELYYWQELSTPEIAQVLEIPVGSVRSRLSRGRTLLRERIVEMDIPEQTRTGMLRNLEDWARQLGEALREDSP